LPRSRRPDRSAHGPALVVSGTEANQSLRDGVATIAAILRPTLGPNRGRIAIIGNVRNAAPELLGSAGIIARRTVEIEGRFRNMGAMLLRQLVWQMHEIVGDGGATVAVVASDLVDRALRYAEAGGDRLAIARGIEAAAMVGQSAVGEAARPVRDPAEIASVVQSITGDATAALMVGEAVEQTGASGAVLVRRSRSGIEECEFAPGAVWDAGAHSDEFLRTDRGSIDDPYVLVTDLAVDQAACIAILQAALRAGVRSLVIAAPSLSTEAIGLMIVNRDRGTIPALLAVRTPTTTTLDTRVIEDLAIVTGATYLTQMQGARLDQVQPSDFGRARQVWATRGVTGIIGGAGDLAAIELRIEQIDRELDGARTDNARINARKRIGRLAGVTVTLRAGGSNEAEVNQRVVTLEAAVSAGRAAVAAGVVAGGGVALLDAAEAIRAMPLSGDDRVGAQMLAQALEAPFRTLLENSGRQPSTFLASRGDGVFDTVSGTWVDPWITGIVDPARVPELVIQFSASFANTVLRTDTLLSRLSREVSIAP
jgi:chaperonin GroEL